MGRVGAINTPTARMAEAGTIQVHGARREPYWIAGVSIQPLSRLSLTYRRSVDNRSEFDRGFRFSGGLDGKFMLSREGEYAPQLSLGIDAIAGNGIFGSEYLVASKRVGALDLSLGMGWGRLAGAGPLANGFSLAGGHFDRPERREEFDRGPAVWFSGDRVGLFGSATYRLPWSLPWLEDDQKPNLIVEYDSDQYWAEQRFDPDFEPGRIPINIGIEASLGAGFRAGISSERFQSVSARLSWSFNPAQRRDISDISPLTLPVRPASRRSIPKQSQSGTVTKPIWLDAATVPADELAKAILEQSTTTALANPEATMIVANLGNRGLPTASLTMGATDLRDLASGDASAEEVWHRAESRTNNAPSDTEASPFLDRVRLTISPETILDGFETSSGLVARQSLLFDAEYSGNMDKAGASLRVNLADNLDRLALDRGFSPFPVRSNLADFADNRLWLDRAYYGTAEHIAPDLYIGGIAGLLEEQYAGFNTQFLYWPHQAKWAIGGHATQVFSRDPDSILGWFGEQSLTAELTGYYHFPSGVVAKAGLVRYLGTDMGLTVELMHPLGGGWQLDTYLAFSDADQRASQRLAQFAETGGADFGVRLTAPLGQFVSGLIGVRPTVSVQALGRDQAQRLDLPYTLYDLVAPAHMNAVVKSWPGLGLH